MLKLYNTIQHSINVQSCTPRQNAFTLISRLINPIFICCTHTSKQLIITYHRANDTIHLKYIESKQNSDGTSRILYYVPPDTWTYTLKIMAHIPLMYFFAQVHTCRFTHCITNRPQTGLRDIANTKCCACSGEC